MNHHRQSLVSPVLLQQQHQLVSEDNKALLHEQVVRDNSMLQSYPDYLDLPYNVPSCDYNLDTQSWYPYLQPGTQSNGPYLDRPTETKLPVDWSTPYSSEQGNFIRASPQSSPYSMQNHQEVNPLMMNGDHSSAVNPEQTTHCENNCLAVEHKPIVDQLVCQNSDANVVKDPEQQVKELLASAKVISEGSPVLNGGTALKMEDGSSTRLPGFHQAFGSTEIGRFSQPDGFFEAAVAAENERKQTPEVSEFTFSFSPSSTFLCCPKTEPDLFGFQESEDPCFSFSPSQFNEPNHLYTLEDGLYSDEFVGEQLLMDHSIVKLEDSVETDKLESQDLSGVANLGKPPVIISENDNCCVVQLESSSLDNNAKQYFSL